MGKVFNVSIAVFAATGFVFSSPQSSKLTRF
jgi:hypothetical protein